MSSMKFRDPRVLDEQLDTNRVGSPGTAPEAETVPDADRAAGTSTWTQGYESDNATHLTPIQPIDDEAYSHGVETNVVYPGGQPDTNRSRGANDRDEAIDASRGLTGTAEPTGPIDPVEAAALRKAN